MRTLRDLLAGLGIPVGVSGLSDTITHRQCCSEHGVHTSPHRG